MHTDIPSTILDVLNIADAETSVFDSQNEETKERVNFCYIVKECEKVVKYINLTINFKYSISILVFI